MSQRVAHRKDANGNKIANDSHARFYPWEHRSAAFRSLTPNAVRLLLELKMLFNGRNNGTLFLSVREAARRIGVGKNQAAQAFADLRDRGFLRANAIGSFNQKSAARRGLATSWVLTEFPVGDDKGAGTRDFMRWTPGKAAAARSTREAGGEDPREAWGR
jgi:DNA-binding transcriptional MocR family regulator